MAWPEGIVLLGVAIGGAVGALVRFGIVLLETKGEGASRFPWATIGVNNLGAALLGLTWAAGATGTTWGLAIAAGLCGALTTFSSFAVQSEQLWQSKRWGALGLNTVLSSVCPVAVLWLAWWAGSLVF